MPCSYIRTEKSVFCVVIIPTLPTPSRPTSYLVQPPNNIGLFWHSPLQRKKDVIYVSVSIHLTIQINNRRTILAND
jgi:hypothetical protein